MKKKIKLNRSAARNALVPRADLVRVRKLNKILQDCCRQNLESILELYKQFLQFSVDVACDRYRPEALVEFSLHLKKDVMKMQKVVDDTSIPNTLKDANGSEYGNFAIARRGSLRGNPPYGHPDQQHEKPAGELRQVQGSIGNFIHPAHEARNIF
ncbi:MAG TPA: hypothetical protein VE954_27365 [Oligoflexus sp.]|uniref:hypothetical protein n=1 Tax=Oligoflexus sp. TaxID=1971216 RepID=UPI002D379020|nr:hypothetical protein [Oligoflexus sp.]HYX36844.1 hypothetical protein [Oligoflexus sp.]